MRLPTRNELKLMYTQLHLYGIGNFTDKLYWSSSEYILILAWNHNFYNGTQNSEFKSNCDQVRSVRDFKSTKVYQLRDFGQMGYIFKIRKLKSGFKYTEALPWDSIHEITGEQMSWHEAMESKLTRFNIINKGI